MRVYIKYSKTDQKGEGRNVLLPLKDGRYCPVKSLKKWVEVAQIVNGPLFYKITKSNYISEGNPLWEPKSIEENFNNLKHSDGRNYFYSAPTQSELQKWLRDKHNILVLIDRGDKPYITFQHNRSKEDFDTYEEALEKGLQEALKLI